jgi:hypothetical protein
MSYPKDLEEYTDEQLAEEQHRRQLCRRAGKCSYCNRPLRSEPACKMNELHELYPATHPGSILRRRI